MLKISLICYNFLHFKQKNEIDFYLNFVVTICQHEYTIIYI